MTHEMLVRLTKKLAETVDGVDLTPFSEGDLIEVPERDAQLLIAERWAERVPRRRRVRSGPNDRAVAADRRPRASKRRAGSAAGPAGPDRR